MSDRVLIIDEPNVPERKLPWTKETREQFFIDADDAEMIESGEILWRGHVAYSLEEFE